MQVPLFFKKYHLKIKIIFECVSLVPCAFFCNNASTQKALALELSADCCSAAGVAAAVP